MRESAASGTGLFEIKLPYHAQALNLRNGQTVNMDLVSAMIPRSSQPSFAAACPGAYFRVSAAPRGPLEEESFSKTDL